MLCGFILMLSRVYIPEMDAKLINYIQNSQFISTKSMNKTDKLVVVVYFGYGCLTITMLEILDMLYLCELLCRFKI